MINALASVTVEQLLPLWRQVFPGHTVTPESNFFDLDGDRAVAEKLASQISSACRREVCPLLLYQAPSIAKLVALLSEQRNLPVPSIFKLNAGNDAPPIFMAHGLGDTVVGLADLVKNMRLSRAVYGMQARGVDGLSSPLGSIEEMAEYHLPDVRRVQPVGPYYLIGYSLGGLVVLEVARRLSGLGEKIASLVMLDSYPDRHQLSIGQQMRLDWRLAKRRLKSRILGRREASLFSRDTGSMNVSMEKVRHAQYLALRTYEPSFYDGTVKFVRAAVISNFPSDPQPVWSPLVRELEIQTIPGNHVEMLKENVSSLSKILAGLVSEGSVQPLTGYETAKTAGE